MDVISPESSMSYSEQGHTDEVSLIIRTSFYLTF
jgi:hypothetical protein